ncbi:MAG: hypothetical protein M3169_07400 [Candidatus Eremiobacteraeota bacterium]|nr:hypothetical protein [Candidatus Eremiobacteraeota bacterium]
MDCIRTIEGSATEEELDDWLFGHRTARLYFGGRPRHARVGDLMFIAFHGRMVAVGTVANMDDEPREDGFYWITLRAVRAIPGDNPAYRGYASIKYVDRLAAQFGGRYAKLAKRLVRIAQDYRSEGGPRDTAGSKRTRTATRPSPRGRRAAPARATR